VTAEDLVEEIVGEIDDENRRAVPDALREPDGSLVLRGSVSVERLEELLGVTMEREPDAVATTAAGLLNELAGHVPLPGEVIATRQVRFDVVDANQRKVLRLRARVLAAPQEPVKDLAEAKTAQAAEKAGKGSSGTPKAARATRSGK